MNKVLLSDYTSTCDLTDFCAATRHWRELNGGHDQILDLGGLSWNLWPEVAMETQVFPSNNDAGRVKTGLLLQGLKDVVVEGNGAKLLVRGSPLAGHGRMTVLDAPMLPIIVEDCENIVLRNFSIDWKTPATIQGSCLKIEDDSFVVVLETDQKFTCWNDQLYIEGEGWTWPVRRLLAADQVNGAILPGSGDNFGLGYDMNWTYRLIGPRTVKITGPAGGRPQVGSLVLFWCSNHDTGARRSPGIFINRSRRVTLENVTLHYTWGMGVIGQNSEDILMSRVVVEPSADRKFSLACDGSHFVGCRGNLIVDQCRFQNQFDDAFNAHGLYYQAIRKLSARVLRVRTMHPQHQGVVALRAGDRLGLQARPYLLSRGELILKSLFEQNSETIDLTFESDIPASFEVGDLVENLTAYPNITIRDCTIRWNRARGILINGGGKIVVEKNKFETAGAAILIESSPIWGESGPIQDMTIRNNLFHDCTHTQMWGKAVIMAAPEFRENAPANLPPFHGKLTVVNNEFSRCHAPELLAQSFREVVRT